MEGGQPHGQRIVPQDIEGRLGELELSRVGREGSEGMYSLPQLMATQQTEPSSYQGLTAKEQEEMGTGSSDMRAILHESGQTLEPESRKLKGSPALEIFTTHLDKAMSNLGLIFNVTLF